MTDEVSFCKNCLEQLNSARLRKQYQTTLICLRWHAKNSAGMVSKQLEVLNAHFLRINFIKFYTIFSHDIDDINLPISVHILCIAKPVMHIAYGHST